MNSIFQRTGHYLDPDEQREVVGQLLRHGLIKYSNKCDLPLKGGGYTDIYMNLREMRNEPDSIRLLARIYGLTLQRLGVNRFVEVPEAVSGLAGAISYQINMPYLTIRETAKNNRVVTGRFIGSLPKFGERIAIIDDVVTNGVSKVSAARELQGLGVIPTLVVLVDRNHGWKTTFENAGIQMPVWAGMTLDDVRFHLIQTYKVMERCDATKENANPIILALDGKSWSEFLPIIEELRPTGCIFKVNDLLHDQSIPDVVPRLQTYGRVMIDAKWHDIPTTVFNSASRYRHVQPWAVTVHASGGEEMIRGAVNAFTGTETKVLAVTVLTSMGPIGCGEIYRSCPMVQVKTLAEIAHKAGVHGFVCSPEEAKVLRGTYPDALIITPGIRSSGVNRDDQSRSATPAEAMLNGADYLVMGRQILKSESPTDEVYRVLREELRVPAFS